MNRWVILALGALLLPACSSDHGGGNGGEGGSGGAGGAGGQGGTGGAGGTGGTGGAGGGQGGEGGSGALDCTTLSHGITKTIPSPTTCTSVVRLDYASHAVLGYRILCGPYAQASEAAARATAQADTGYGAAGESLAGATPEDAYVFYESPGDFGGAAAVSVRSGLSVFGGSIVWDGAGDITYPATWDPAEHLGAECVPSIEPPPARGFDLGSGSALPAADVESALAVVWQTSLPGGLAPVHSVFDAVVLLYPRSVGAFDPMTAEWIVLVNSGWLE